MLQMERMDVFWKWKRSIGMILNQDRDLNIYDLGYKAPPDKKFAQLRLVHVRIFLATHTTQYLPIVVAEEAKPVGVI